MIVTDSQSILSNICSLGLRNISNSFLAEILRLLFEIKVKGLDVALVWIPSHCGISLNERVDSIASDSSIVPILIDNNVFYTDLFGSSKIEVLEFMRRWVNGYGSGLGGGGKGVKYVENNEPFSFVPWFSSGIYDRKRVTIINRIKSGHVRTRAHLFSKGLVGCGLCDCSEMQTLNHLIWHCPKFSTFRPPLISFLAERNIVMDSDISVIFNTCKNNSTDNSENCFLHSYKQDNCLVGYSTGLICLRVFEIYNIYLCLIIGIIFTYR